MLASAQTQCSFRSEVAEWVRLAAVFFYHPGKDAGNQITRGFLFSNEVSDNPRVHPAGPPCSHVMHLKRTQDERKLDNTVEGMPQPDAL